MGEFFQAVVDRDVSLEDANDLALRVRDWLVAKRIIDPAASDCVLGESAGYPPGADFRQAIEGSGDGVLGLVTNGMAIVVGRTVFDAGQGLFETVTCPGCSGIVGEFDDCTEVIDAIGKWHEGSGQDLILCRHCGSSASVAECVFDPPWGFGNLGFKVWNWTPLRPSFVAELSAQLGHRTVLVRGKL